MTRSATPQPPQDNPPPADPTVTPPARTDGRSDGLETKKPIKVFRAGVNAGSDGRSTAASTRS